MSEIEYNFYPIVLELVQNKDEPKTNTSAVAVADSNIADSANGSIVNGGTIQSPNFSPGNAGWRLDSNGNIEANDGNFRGDITGASGTFSGTVTVNAIDIGGDDATSAHIDSAGNLWLGASVANKATAPARISNAGMAVFTDVKIGGAGIQYIVSDVGMSSFGDGSDSDLTTSGNVTLTADKYYDNLTVAAGHIFNPAGWRIFVKRTLTVNGTIARNGNNGGNGGVGNGTDNHGLAGATLTDGYLKGSQGAVGGKGADAGDASTAGGNGNSTTNSIGVNGVEGGAGGAGSGSAGKDHGTLGTAMASNVKLIANWHLSTLLDVSSTGATVKFDNSAGGSGGGGGGRGTSSSGFGGGGGGSGSGGGIVAIYAKDIVIGATGVVSANGGVGGNGGNGYHYNAGDDGGGGGGGAGGNGGQLIFVYNSFSNSGSVSCSGGAGGSGGLKGGGTAVDGSAGTTGADGTIRYFCLSL